MDKLGIVIQARMNSSRLPGKVLMDFCGIPLLQFQLEILQDFGFDSNIVIATTKNSADDQIEQLCQNLNFHVVRGSEEDVFQRYCLVADQFQFDHIVRLTGDNPFTSYAVLTACIETHSRTNPDLTSTRRIRPDRTLERYVPKGKSIDVIKCHTLLSIDQSSLDEFEKEHVIPVFFRDNYDVSFVDNIRVPGPSFSIDTHEDLECAARYTRNFPNRRALLQALGYADTLEPDAV